jgi:hypothetical protein
MANIVAKAASFNPENHLILANPGSDCGKHRGKPPPPCPMANIVAKAASFNPENHLILANPGSDNGKHRGKPPPPCPMANIVAMLHPLIQKII